MGGFGGFRFSPFVQGITSENFHSAGAFGYNPRAPAARRTTPGPLFPPIPIPESNFPFPELESCHEQSFRSLAPARRR